MKKIIKKAVCLMTVGVMTVQAPLTFARADVVVGENSLVGITEALSRYYESVKLKEKKDTTELYATFYEVPENIAIADVTGSLNIRYEPSTASSRIGILAKDGACIVESVDSNGWAKITSGDVKGYVATKYLIMGEEAQELAKEYATLYATVKSVSSLNVRSAPSTSADIVTRVSSGERLIVTKEVVVNKEDPNAKVWVEVKLDSDSDENAVAYVSADYVTTSYELVWANRYTPYGANVSDLRVAICDYAHEWIGTEYVWGGNSLTKGIDCSGFVQQVFKKFGYAPSEKTRRWVSKDMAKQFKKISYSELKPGDLVFYGKKSTVDHVAIYIGNNQVIHSSVNTKGVGISKLHFYTVLQYGRIINE